MFKNHTNDNNDLSVIYRIPCSGCPSAYIGESGRGIEKRINEHRNDLKAHRTSNSLVRHLEICNNLPEWSKVEILHKGLKKKMRKTVEAAHINVKENNNDREGFICLSKAASLLIINALEKT